MNNSEVSKWYADEAIIRVNHICSKCGEQEIYGYNKSTLPPDWRKDSSGNIYCPECAKSFGIRSKFCNRGRKDLFNKNSSTIKILKILTTVKTLHRSKMAEYIDCSTDTIGNALSNLVKRGFIKRVKPGWYTATDEGVTALQSQLETWKTM